MPGTGSRSSRCELLRSSRPSRTPRYASSSGWRPSPPSRPPSEGLLDTAAGRELIARYEDFGAELVAMPRWLGAAGCGQGDGS
jgi:hypothetical protein